jgi:hypothetical protein
VAIETFATLRDQGHRKSIEQDRVLMEWTRSEAAAVVSSVGQIAGQFPNAKRSTFRKSRLVSIF